MTSTQPLRTPGFQIALFASFVLHCSWLPVSDQLTAQDSSQNPTAVQTVSRTKPIDPKHPLVGALRLAKESRDRLKNVQDYTCQFFKRDVVNGKVWKHNVGVKFRESPMSVYMRFGPPNKGREVIYVKGQNGGQLLAHETGLLGLVGTVAVKPDSPRALSESRHPITEFGMKKLIDGAIAQWENEARFAASETEVKFYPKAKLSKRECQVIETRHPVHRREFNFYVTRLYIDNETLYPVRLEHYGFPSKPNQPPPLIEEYTFFNVQVNRGLTDADFDPRNPQYDFK